MRWLIALSLLLVCIVSVTAASLEDSYRERDAGLSATDVEGHFQLSQWCKANRLLTHYHEQLEQTLALAPEHAEARRLLGYEKVNGAWYRGDDLQTARGLVLYKGHWVAKEFAENTEKGLIQYLGRWLTPDDVARARGYVKYHGTWISPSRLKAVQARQAEARERIKFASDWKNAWAYRTEPGHFVIRSNVSPELVRQIGDAMEQCFSELAKVFAARSAVKAIVVEVYATQQQFMQHSAEAGIPVSDGVLGYFFYGNNDIGIRCFYAGSIERTLSTLFHECTHLVIHQACGDNVPTWANEGLAVFFESAERDEKAMRLQTIPFDRLWQLKSLMKRGDLSLNNLCRIQGPAQYGAQYYPQGWSLIYYLFYAGNGKYRNAFQGFYGALTAKNKPEFDNLALFKKSFGVEPDELRDDWHGFMQNLEPKTTDELVSAAQAAYTAWLDFDAAEQFATLALQSPKGRDDPKVLLCNARLYLSLGRWESDPKQGDEEFAKSVLFFERVFPAPLKDAKPAVTKTQRITPQYARDHLDFARACIGARRYEQAQDLIDDVLARKEFEFCADAYSCLAFLAVASADDSGFHDLDVAKENVVIADDLGADQDNKYVHALIELAEGRKDRAAAYLSEGAARDEFGFAGQFYRRELARLAGALKKKRSATDGTDGIDGQGRGH